jgi:hypothetical protein
MGIELINNGSSRHSAIFTPDFGRDADGEKSLTISESSPVFSFQWAARFSALVKDEEQAEMFKMGGIHSMFQFFYDRPLFSLIKDGQMQAAIAMIFELLEVCVTNPINAGRFTKGTADNYLAEPDSIEEIFKSVLYLHTVFTTPGMNYHD